MIGLSLLFSMLLIGGVAAPSLAEEVVEHEEIFATAELVDRSQLKGKALIDHLPVKLPYAELDIPLASIDKVTISRENGEAILMLSNQDRLTGEISRADFPLQTILGTLEPTFDVITRLRISSSKRELPLGEGPISFGGFNWVGWRTGFEVRDDKVLTLPKAAEGFRYGHGGHGRNAMLYTNIGNEEWDDYRIEFVYCYGPVDPTFNPHGLPSSHRVGYIRFRVADAKESWNEIGRSSYTLGLQANGDWSLSRSLNGHTPRSVGYSSWVSEGAKTLASGEGLKTDPVNGNHYVIEVKGNRITIHVDGNLLVETEDPDMHKKYSGINLTYGGVGFEWLWESMGWVRDFSATGI